MRFPRMAMAAVVLLALTGCALWPGGSAKPVPQELGPNVPLLGVRQAWVVKLDGVLGAPLGLQVAEGTVTVTHADGTVAAISATTGQLAWSARLSTPLSSAAGTDGRLVAVVTRGNFLVVLEAGREIWRSALPSQGLTAPLVAGGRIFVLTADRSVVAFDAADGRRLWSQQRGGDALILRQSGVLMPVGNTLLAGISGRLVALNPDTGSVKWEAPIAVARGTNDVERLVDIVGRVSRWGDSVCARAFQSAVGCVGADRGNVLWTQQAVGSEGVDGDETSVFGVESNGVVTAWRRSDGARQWSTERLKFRRLTAPLVLGRSIVVGDDSGTVHFLSRTDGSPLNRLTTDTSGVSVSPVVAANTLIVVTRSGMVFGFRPE